jgi:hypothetical protein
MLKQNDAKLRLYGIPILRAMISKELNTLPIAHRCGCFHILEQCMANVLEGTSDDAKTRANSVVQAAAALDSLMNYKDLKNRMGKKQAARLHATLGACREFLADDPAFKKLAPALRKPLEWSVAATPAQDEGADYTASLDAAIEMVTAFNRRLEMDGVGAVQPEEITAMLQHLHRHVISAQLIQLADKACTSILNAAPASRFVEKRAALVDAGLIPAAVKVLAQHCHGSESDCKQTALTLLRRAIIAGDVSSGGDDGEAAKDAATATAALAAAALTTDVGDALFDSRSLCHSLIITLNTGCVFDRFLKADEQEAKLILPAFELLELLVAAPIESILTAVLAEDLRIAIFEAVEYRPQSKLVQAKGHGLLNAIAEKYAEWGEAPWVVKGAEGGGAGN